MPDQLAITEAAQASHPALHHPSVVAAARCGDERSSQSMIDDRRAESLTLHLHERSPTRVEATDAFVGEETFEAEIVESARKLARCRQLSVRDPRTQSPSPIGTESLPHSNLGDTQHARRARGTPIVHDPIAASQLRHV
jgi:hypothetical protein